MFNPYQSMFQNLLDDYSSIDIFKILLQNDPDFVKFICEHEGKSIEDICLEYDIDIEILNNHK